MDRLSLRTILLKNSCKVKITYLVFRVPLLVMCRIRNKGREEYEYS